MSQGMAGMTMDLLEGAKSRVSALGSDLAQAPDELHGVLAVTGGVG